jgi:hypothetical protein
MSVKVNIHNQWGKLSLWQIANSQSGNAPSIWEMLEKDYSANYTAGNSKSGIWVIFPDEKTYTAFLLKWA